MVRWFQIVGRIVWFAAIVKHKFEYTFELFFIFLKFHDANYFHFSTDFIVEIMLKSIEKLAVHLRNIWIGRLLGFIILPSIRHSEILPLMYVYIYFIFMFIIILIVFVLTYYLSSNLTFCQQFGFIKQSNSYNTEVMFNSLLLSLKTCNLVHVIEDLLWIYPFILSWMCIFFRDTALEKAQGNLEKNRLAFF